MSSPNFYNLNRNRAFPFLKGSVGIDTPAAGPFTMRQLPGEVIVDCGFVMGVEADYQDDIHTVYLYRIRRDGDTFFFEFASDTDSLAGVTLVFTRQLGEEDYAMEHLDLLEASGGADSQSLAGYAPQAWSGYLVTGRLSALADRLAPGASVVRGDDDAVVEPALILNLAKSYLGSVSLANQDRTRITAVEGCDELVWENTAAYFVDAYCITGAIRWQEGYNCRIQQDNEENAIILKAEVGGGEGEPCAEIPLYSGEGPPLGGLSSLLTGGYRCNEVLRSINGVGGPLFTLRPGLGVSITPNPGTHRITIDVNMMGLAVCYSTSEVSESI